MNNQCLFCYIPNSRVMAENKSYYMIRDRFPVSLGHSLIIPKRHIESLFELASEEFSELYELLHMIRITAYDS